MLVLLLAAALLVLCTPGGSAAGHSVATGWPEVATHPSGVLVYWKVLGLVEAWLSQGYRMQWLLLHWRLGQKC